MAKATLQGNCYLCGRTISKSGYRRHFNSTHVPELPDGQKCALLKIESAYNPNYWLFVDIALTSKLESLDSFLRDIWLECCGHMSSFMGTGYGDEYGMTRKMQTFSPGDVLRYVYDYGDTTELKITVLAHTTRPPQRRTVRLLARNLPHEETCRKCGAPAEWVCVECRWPENNPFFCDDCASSHNEETGHEFLLPVVNSPRMGVCAYVGERDVYTFDPSAFEADKEKV